MLKVFSFYNYDVKRGNERNEMLISFFYKRKISFYSDYMNKLEMDILIPAKDFIVCWESFSFPFLLLIYEFDR